MNLAMKAFTGLIVCWLAAAPLSALAQDPMQYRLKHLTVLAEDDKVRVLKYAAKKGDKTPVHSHPSTVVYVTKGGKVRYSMPDGTTKEVKLHPGVAFLPPPVTHADEALDDVEAILVELKK